MRHTIHKLDKQTHVQICNTVKSCFCDLLNLVLYRESSSKKWINEVNYSVFGTEILVMSLNLDI